ncbi:hypothetical protein R3P38DRAFT_2781125 [Favolaschia claudopus]|uniref:Uncharacterized protein n=1 Tax=Favolaschia claudopus TaxID=2862362 RepID=A0AAW0B4Y7_9AGAR
MAREDDPISESDLQRMERDFGREIKKLVNDARGNKDSYGFRLVVVAEFDFMAAVAGARQAVPTESYVWMDAVPRVACSADGFGLVVHLPGAIKRASADILLNNLVDFVDLGFKGKLSLVAGADGKTRDQEGSYHVRPGQIAGLFKLHSTPVPSRDMLKTGTGFVASLDLIAQLRLVSHRVNCVVEEVDPVYYAQLKELHAAASKRYRFYDVLGTKDPLYMEGRELMYNRQTPLHPDKSDPKLGWAVLVVVGPFTGGDLVIPCLNMRLLYTHGTIIMHLPFATYDFVVLCYCIKRLAFCFADSLDKLQSFPPNSNPVSDDVLGSANDQHNSIPVSDDVLGYFFAYALNALCDVDVIAYVQMRAVLQMYLVWVDGNTPPSDLALNLERSGVVPLRVVLDISEFDRTQSEVREYFADLGDSLDIALARCVHLTVCCEALVDYEAVFRWLSSFQSSTIRHLTLDMYPTEDMTNAHASSMPVFPLSLPSSLSVVHSLVLFGSLITPTNLTKLVLDSVGHDGEIYAVYLMDGLKSCVGLTHLHLIHLRTMDVPSRTILEFGPSTCHPATSSPRFNYPP